MKFRFFVYILFVIGTTHCTAPDATARDQAVLAEEQAPSGRALLNLFNQRAEWCMQHSVTNKPQVGYFLDDEHGFQRYSIQCGSFPDMHTTLPEQKEIVIASLESPKLVIPRVMCPLGKGYELFAEIRSIEIADLLIKDRNPLIFGLTTGIARRVFGTGKDFCAIFYSRNPDDPWCDMRSCGRGVGENGKKYSEALVAAYAALRVKHPKAQQHVWPVSQLSAQTTGEVALSCVPGLVPAY